MSLASLLRGLSWGAPADEEARSRAFEGLYLEYRDLVRRCAFRLGGEEDLDDIVQETFVRIWKGMGSFRQDAQVKTWVYRVTLNTAREHWRKRGRYKDALAAGQAPEEAVTPDPEASRQVAAALEGLSPEHREAVALVYFEGLSLAEAAEAASVPQGTLKSRLHYAKEQLSRRLTP